MNALAPGSRQTELGGRFSHAGTDASYEEAEIGNQLSGIGSVALSI
jgi:hypothetical protein